MREKYWTKDEKILRGEKYGRRKKYWADYKNMRIEERVRVRSEERIEVIREQMLLILLLLWVWIWWRLRLDTAELTVFSGSCFDTKEKNKEENGERCFQIFFFLALILRQNTERKRKHAFKYYSLCLALFIYLFCHKNISKEGRKASRYSALSLIPFLTRIIK